MFSSVFTLAALLNNVSARCSEESCDGRSEVSADCFTKFGECEDSKIAEIACISPFICGTSCCPSWTKPCKPYLEFANIAEFLAPLPSADKLKDYFWKGDLKALTKLATNCSGCCNYDGLIAFFFNADAFFGINSRVFDDNFILYFLQRFYYFLDLILDNPTIKVYNNNLYCIKTQKMFDLLCIPEPYASLNFGTPAEALKLFNSVIENPVINSVLDSFIKVLLIQISLANKRCVTQSSRLSEFNTYTSYISLLNAYLLKTAEISNRNVTNVETYGLSQVTFCYIYFPYTTTTGPNPNYQVQLLNVNTSQYVGPKTYRFLQSKY